MPYYNPFADDWRESLRAHYMHVIRVDDKVTERTLSRILLRLNFSEAELAEMRVLATMRTEDMGEDYVPDFAAVEALVAAEVEAAQRAAEAEAVTPPPTAEAPLFPAITIPNATAPSEAVDDTTLEPAPPEEPATPPPDEYYAPPDDTPQQLSLF
jgi:hypothetical protein